MKTLTPDEFAVLQRLYHAAKKKELAVDASFSVDLTRSEQDRSESIMCLQDKHAALQEALSKVVELEDRLDMALHEIKKYLLNS